MSSNLLKQLRKLHSSQVRDNHVTNPVKEESRNGTSLEGNLLTATVTFPFASISESRTPVLALVQIYTFSRAPVSRVPTEFSHVVGEGGGDMSAHVSAPVLILCRN